MWFRYVVYAHHRAKRTTVYEHFTKQLVYKPLHLNLFELLKYFLTLYRFP